MPIDLDRILFEIKIMSERFPQFKFYWGEDNNSGYFEGWYPSITANPHYSVKLVLPRCYPHEQPRLYVTFPLILWKYGGGTINALGTTHAFHTFKNGPTGCVQICPYPPGTWDASKSCIGVFVRSILWIEAYGVHLRTGMTIHAVLEEWKKRQS